MTRFSKTFILALSLSVVFTSLVLLPNVQSYGSVGSPETITNGSVSQTLMSYDTSAWYQISCAPGNSLYISLYHYSTDLDLYLYNTVNGQVESSTNSYSSDSISYVCTMSGYYKIEVRRIGSAVDAQITMQVTGAASMPSVPGYDIATMILVMVFSVSALGLVVLKKNSKRMSATA